MNYVATFSPPKSIHICILTNFPKKLCPCDIEFSQKNLIVIQSLSFFAAWSGQGSGRIWMFFHETGRYNNSIVHGPIGANIHMEDDTTGHQLPTIHVGVKLKKKEKKKVNMCNIPKRTRLLGVMT